MSTLEFKWTYRVLVGAQTPRRFLDFVIDGNSLYKWTGDFISPFGWLSAEESQAAVNRLLRKAAADLPNNRTSIYIGPECGDLGCGALSAVVERRDENIIWRDFGFQNNYDDTVHFEDLRDLGPFAFNATEYFQAISSALDIKGRSITKANKIIFFDGKRWNAGILLSPRSGQ